MQLNGWQRLWVVASGLWAFWLLTQGWEVPNALNFRNALTLWALPATALYLAGLTVRCVARGFRHTSPAS